MPVGPRRALIVTDVSLLQWALSSAFGQAGFVALTAKTADAALDTLGTVREIHLVVVSLSIHAEQVREIVRACTLERPGMPVLLLAAAPDTPSPEQYEASVLLEQPFSVADIIAAAEKLAPGHQVDFRPNEEPLAGDVTRA